MPGTHYTVSSDSERIIFLDGDHHPGGKSVHSPTSTESQSGHSSIESWAQVSRSDYDIEPSDSASRSRRPSQRPPEAPPAPTRRHSSRSAVVDDRQPLPRRRSNRPYRSESRRAPSDESTSTLASNDDYPGYPAGSIPHPQHQQRQYYRAPASHSGYPPSVAGVSPYTDAFQQAQALVHMAPPVDAFGYPINNPFASSQPNPFAPMPPPAAPQSGYFPSDAHIQQRPHPAQRMSMYAGAAPYSHDMYHAQALGYPHNMYPPHMQYMYPPPQPASQPASPPPAEDKSAKEFESLREIIKKHEEDRVKWEKELVARAEAEAAAKAAAKAKAEEEAKRKEEVAAASAKAKEAAEKKAEDDAKKASAEAEKKLAEAKQAQETAEKKSKELEDEKKKNAPAPDADKEPIKFKDAAHRKFSFPWSICKTWKGMESLVKQAFLHIDVLGPHVLEGHYDLVGPDGEIILPQVWETTVKPGWEIEMIMWPMQEVEAHQPSNDIFDMAGLDSLLAGMGTQPQKPTKAPKNGKTTKKTSKGKEKNMIIPVPPMHAHDQFAELMNMLPPGGLPADVKPPKLKASSSKSKQKDLPFMARWITGGAPPRKK